jgi:hypothetical protein
MYVIWTFGGIGVITSFSWGAVAETLNPTYQEYPELCGVLASVVIIVVGFVVRRRLKGRSIKLQPGLSDEEALRLRKVNVIVFGNRKSRAYLLLREDWRPKPVKDDPEYVIHDPEGWRPRYGQSFEICDILGYVRAQVQLNGPSYEVEIKSRLTLALRWTAVGFVYDIIDRRRMQDEVIYTTTEHVSTPGEGTEESFDIQCRSAHQEALTWAAECGVQWIDDDWELSYPLRRASWRR